MHYCIKLSDKLNLLKIKKNENYMKKARFCVKNLQFSQLRGFLLFLNTFQIFHNDIECCIYFNQKLHMRQIKQNIDVS